MLTHRFIRHGCHLSIEEEHNAARERDGSAAKGFAAFLQAHMSSRSPRDHFVRTFRNTTTKLLQTKHTVTMEELRDVGHNVFIKDEPLPDTPWLGLASIPAAQPEDSMYASYADDRSFLTPGFRDIINLTSMSNYQFAHSDSALWPDPLLLPSQQDLQSTGFDGPMHSLVSSIASDTSSLDATGYTSIAYLPTMNPRALDLSPRVASPPIDSMHIAHNGVDTNSFETFSHWSYASADLESLARDSFEQQEVQSADTPASSISDDSEYYEDDDVANGWLELVAPEEVTVRKRVPRTSGGWRSGRVTSGNVHSDLDVTGAYIPLGVHERTQKDNYLLSMRERGLSYKEIKRRGKFREAESTLRGRVRVLTKAKEDRVRKPIWTRNDIKLLRTALRRHYNLAAFDSKSTSAKVPWKRIAHWLYDNGASYKFASATCARKWDEISKES